VYRSQYETNSRVGIRILERNKHRAPTSHAHLFTMRPHVRLTRRSQRRPQHGSSTGDKLHYSSAQRLDRKSKTDQPASRPSHSTSSYAETARQVRRTVMWEATCDIKQTGSVPEGFECSERCSSSGTSAACYKGYSSFSFPTKFSITDPLRINRTTHRLYSTTINDRTDYKTYLSGSAATVACIRGESTLISTRG